MVEDFKYTKGQVDRAGRTLCRALTGEEPLPSAAEVTQAAAVAEAFRQAHRDPMAGANMDLHACVEVEGLVATELAQRLKRLPTVVDKLRRLPTMKLSGLQDLGGCRAVLATQDEVARVQRRFMISSLQRNGVEDTVRDYVAMPETPATGQCTSGPGTEACGSKSSFAPSSSTPGRQASRTSPP